MVCQSGARAKPECTGSGSCLNVPIRIGLPMNTAVPEVSTSLSERVGARVRRPLVETGRVVGAPVPSVVDRILPAAGEGHVEVAAFSSSI